jgi:hypothetical protein
MPSQIIKCKIKKINGSVMVNNQPMAQSFSLNIIERWTIHYSDQIRKQEMYV